MKFLSKMFCSPIGSGPRPLGWRFGTCHCFFTMHLGKISWVLTTWVASLIFCFTYSAKMCGINHIPPLAHAYCSSKQCVIFLLYAEHNTFWSWSNPVQKGYIWLIRQNKFWWQLTGGQDKWSDPLALWSVHVFNVQDEFKIFGNFQKSLVCFLNILPNWGPGCPDSSSFRPLLSSGQEKGCFGVGLGVFFVHTNPRKGWNRGWEWYSGQNETPFEQNETHLGNLYEKWAKALKNWWRKIQSGLLPHQLSRKASWLFLRKKVNKKIICQSAAAISIKTD